MNLPSTSLYKRTLSETGRVPVRKSDGSSRFAMIPADVLKRTDLSSTAKLVFAAMSMESFGSGMASISHPALAKLCGVSRSQVFACMKALRGAGFIEPSGPTVKQVQPYRLLHSRVRFGVDAEKGPIGAEMESSRRSKLLICCKCRRPCKGLLKVGWCRACAADLRLGRKVDEKLDERNIPRREEIAGAAEHLRLVAG